TEAQKEANLSALNIIKMILVDIYDMAGWWSLVVALQVVFISSYYVYSRNKSRKYVSSSNGQLVDWDPAPLVEQDIEVEEPPLIDDKVLNVGATSFLGLDKDESVVNSALECMDKYGVGSCGPRAFYGTIDVHLSLEERLASFLEVEETCVYSYGFSAISSAIPAYVKRADIIFADENVWFAIQKGIQASRSTVRYFKHNDMTDLERQLSEAAKKKELNPRRRAFIIAEGIYYNTGEMCPLRQLVKLARQYKLRIMLDESLTIGVVGKHGRGITELLDIPRDEIDLIMCSLEHSFATAAISALDIIQQRPHIIHELNEISNKMNKALSKLKHFTFRGDALSPIKHIYLTRDLTVQLKQTYLCNITRYCLEKGIAMTTAAYLRDDEANCPEPSIRLAASRKLTDEHVQQIIDLLDEAFEAVGPQPDMVAV
ncbi:Serine palmitoyltransferase 1, partial [Operophtera brumata]